MLPLIILTIIGVLILFLGFTRKTKLIVPIAILGVLGAIAAYLAATKMYNEWMGGMMSLHGPPLIFNYLILVIALFILPFINVFSKRGSEEVADFTGLILFSLIGGIMMVSHLDLIVLFLGIEIMSIAMYILAGADRRILQSNEAALKYFILGAFSSAILLFGIALFYASTGTLKIYDLHVGDSPIFQLSVLIIFCAFAFKVALVPFHFWAPDVYQGSPISITAFMSTVVKTAAFAAFFRLFATSFSQISSSWNDSLGIICAITLLVGNVTAAYQTSVKRLLAFSSIAHAGYMLIALLSLSKIAASSILFYASAYSVASIASFTVLYSILRTKEDAIESFNGLNKRNPFLAFVMTLALLSLAGIPPLAGFFAKYYIFTAAVETNYTWLVLIAVIASLIGIYYYFKLIIAMYFKQDKSNQAIEVSLTHQLILVVAFVLMLVLGIAPGWLIQLI